MIPHRYKGHATAERAQALVEFALVVPLLLTLLMGVVDTSRMLFATVELQEAVQEGAMYAAFNPTPSSAIITRVNSSSDSEVVTGASVTVVCATAPAPGTVLVTAEVDYPLITPLVGSWFGTTIHLGSSVTATNFGGAC